MELCNRLIVLLLVLLLVLSSAIAFGIDYGKSRSLELEVIPEVSGDDRSLLVTWPGLVGLGDYHLQIINGAGESRYEVVPSSGAGLHAYRDTTAVVGERKEYRVVRYPVGSGPSAYGHALGGYALPLTEDRGGVALLVESSQSSTLSEKLARLEGDLRGDGWTVYRQDVSASETPPQLKARILTAHSNHPHINTVFLFGDLAVPYSGNIAPDGHIEHYGAWPADAYYGELDDTWLDTRTNSTRASRVVTHNIPGDGKYDTNKIYSGVELAVGRVDLAELPAFAPLTETDLLRRYLDKNHAFRHRIDSVSERAIVDDNLAHLSEAVAGGARRSFPAIVGRDQVDDLPWSTTQSQDYLFGFGAGGGNYTSVGGIITSSSFAQSASKVCFNFLFGSYSGDFDNTNNLLRSRLATETHGLSACWGARPYWGVYRMALGDTLGDVMRTVYNERASSYYNGGLMQRNVHAALLGDPTLRAHPVASSAAGSASLSASGMVLQWDASPETGLLGYHVYRADEESLQFTRLTDHPVLATSFTDTLPSEANALYMVRAIKMQDTPSGSYTNASQGTYLARIANAASSPMMTWRASAFSGSAMDQGNVANPDGDESPNLIEYALGTDPTTQELFPLTLSVSEGTLTYTENILATDVIIICEMSVNLTEWVPVSFDSQSFEDISFLVLGTQVRLVTLNLSAIPDDRCIFRLRVVSR